MGFPNINTEVNRKFENILLFITVHCKPILSAKSVQKTGNRLFITQMSLWHFYARKSNASASNVSKLVQKNS